MTSGMRGRRQRLVVTAHELRLVINRVHLRRRALHEEQDDAPGPRGEMRLFHRERIRGVREAGEGERPEAERGGAQEVASRSGRGDLAAGEGMEVHGRVFIRG
jgi:hypothetical protein